MSVSGLLALLALLGVPAEGVCPGSGPGRSALASWASCRPFEPGALIDDDALLFEPEQTDRLAATLEAACRQGLTLRVVTTRSGPGFSLVDFADQLWRCAGARSDLAALVASRGGGVHAHVPWLAYAQMRRMARGIARSQPDRAEALLVLAETLRSSHASTGRTRRVLASLAAVAIVLMVVVFGRAAWRQRVARRGAFW